MIFGARRGNRAKIKKDGFLFKTILSMAGTFFYVALTYIYNMAMVRLLPAPDYGSLSIIVALISVIILPFNTIQGLIAREVARLEKHGRHGVVSAMVKKYFKKTFFLSFLLSLVVVLGIFLIYRTPDTFMLSLIVACFSIPFTYA
ncbi:MAG: hypothetical protein NT157_06290, partial [Candidatus Micrarchaeota archaeon]|nr:hypothetical protein [Candidatus Micrarchaeota archaeon]